MKKLKLMALGLMFLMIQGAVAVTLPTTSYSPYQAGGSSSDEGVMLSGGTMVTGNFSALGAGSYPECQEAGESNCSSCCETNYTNSCIDDCLLAHPGKYDYCEDTVCGPTQRACVNECMQGPSVPLDGGLSILLALAFGSGALKFFRARKEA